MCFRRRNPWHRRRLRRVLLLSNRTFPPGSRKYYLDPCSEYGVDVTSWQSPHPKGKTHPENHTNIGRHRNETLFQCLLHRQDNMSSTRVWLNCAKTCVHARPFGTHYRGLLYWRSLLDQSSSYWYHSRRPLSSLPRNPEGHEKVYWSGWRKNALFLKLEPFQVQCCWVGEKKRWKSVDCSCWSIQNACAECGSKRRQLLLFLPFGLRRVLCKAQCPMNVSYYIIFVDWLLAWLLMRWWDEEQLDKVWQICDVTGIFLFLPCSRQWETGL